MTYPNHCISYEDSKILIKFYERQGHSLGVVSFAKLRRFDDQTPLHARLDTGKPFDLRPTVNVSWREYVTATPA